MVGYFCSVWSNSQCSQCSSGLFLASRDKFTHIWIMFTVNALLQYKLLSYTVPCRTVSLLPVTCMVYNNDYCWCRNGIDVHMHRDTCTVPVFSSVNLFRVFACSSCYCHDGIEKYLPYRQHNLKHIIRLSKGHDDFMNTANFANNASIQLHVRYINRPCQTHIKPINNTLCESPI